MSLIRSRPGRLLGAAAAAAVLALLMTPIGGGYATYKVAATIGTSQPKCLAASSANPRPFAALCNPSSTAQPWTRGFVNDGRIENRETFRVLTRLSSGVVEMRFLGGGQVGQNWHEHAV